MGNMIGILSTVILVSTLATLIFAVGAYVMARRRRISNDDEAGEGNEIPEQTEPLRQAPESTQADLPPPPPVPVAKPAKASTPVKVSQTTPPPSPPPAADAVKAAVPTPALLDSPPAAQATPGNKGPKPLFRRLTSEGDQPVDFSDPEKKPGWDWE